MKKIENKRLAVSLADFLLKVVFIGLIVWRKIFGKKTSQAKINNLLIMELWGIGDLVLMSPVLKPLKESYPEAKITLLSKSYGKDLFSDSGCIDNFVLFDFPWTKFARKYRIWEWDWKGLIKTVFELRKMRFDLIIDARGDIRNNLFSFFVGAKRRIGYGFTGGGFLLTDDVKFDYGFKHRIEAWVNLLAHLGIKINSAKPYVSLTDEERSWAKDFLVSNNFKKNDLLIGIHPGAGIKNRCWPIDRFAQLAELFRDKFKAKLIIFTEPEGYGKDFPLEGQYLNLQLPLRKLASLLAELDLLICNDGGIMHMAGAFEVPVLAIFGPGYLPWFKPYGGKNIIIRREGLQCSPCFDHCKQAQRFCLTEISAEYVLGKINNLDFTALKSLKTGDL